LWGDYMVEKPDYYSIKHWLTTTNHKDIGILYLFTSLYFLMVGGSLALLFRLQLAFPWLNILDASAYNQAVTMHGLIMVLWAVSPLAFAFANYLVPLQIGARDLAFPRLNALSYWLYLFSGLLAAVTFFIPGGAPDVGWTYYAPLSTARFSPQPGVTLAGLALVMLIASVTVSTINFIVTVATMRAPGLGWSKIPMFTWSILFTVLLMLFAFSPLAAGVLLLAVDRVFGTAFYTSPEGGTFLWGHLFWFFGHPEVYIVLMPALGIIGDVIETFTRKPLFGRKYILLSMAAASFISFIVYVHHMFNTGMHPIVREVMSLTTESISVPFGIIMLSFIFSLYKAKIKVTTPFLFAIGSIFLFIIGGITGVFNSSIPLNHLIRGTYWVVAHLHYAMVGATLFGLLAGLYYWYPKMTGRMYNERLGKIHFAIAFIGFNVLYLPMFIIYDMPRRVYTYSVPEWIPFNQLETLGGYIFGISFLLLVYNFYKSYRVGAPAGNNPWGGWSLEWLTQSPPPPHNFDFEPVITGDQVTLYTNGGQPEPHIEHMTSLPMYLSLGVFVTFLGFVISTPLFIIGVILTLAVLAKWMWSDVLNKFVIPEPVKSERWPFENTSKLKLGVWILVITEAMLFAGLIGAYSLIRVNMMGEWPPGPLVHDVRLGGINTIVLLTSSLTVALAVAYSKFGNERNILLSLLASLGLAGLFIGIKAIEWSELFAEGFTLTSSLAASTYYVLTSVHAAHVLGGMIVMLYLITKVLKGGYKSGGYEGVENFGIYWHFIDIVWIFLFALFYLL